MPVADVWHKQVISLGLHELPEAGPPQTLMELSMLSVSLRTFPALKSMRCLSPGYYQSPDTADWMVIMFAKVRFTLASVHVTTRPMEP